LRSWTRNGDLDLSFFFGDVPAMPEIQSEPVAEEQLLIILPPNHRLAGCKEIRPEDLAEDAFLVTQTGCVYRKMFDEAFAATESPKLIGEFASIASIRGLVEAGLGCALIPRSAVSEPSANLIAIPWAGKNRTAAVMMTWRRRRVRSPAITAFLATARECLGAR
jgi:DNA-binding transcriptional LysR family regulator